MLKCKCVIYLSRDFEVLENEARRGVLLEFKVEVRVGEKRFLNEDAGTVRLKRVIKLE